MVTPIPADVNNGDDIERVSPVAGKPPTIAEDRSDDATSQPLPEVHRPEVHPIDQPIDQDSLKAKTRRASRCAWLFVCISVVLLSIMIVLVVLYVRSERSSEAVKAGELIVTTEAASEVLPIPRSSLGGMEIELATAPELDNKGQIKVAYNAGGDKICVREKSGSLWLNLSQCIQGANVKPGSPLTMLDWNGGPSIFYITPDNYLSGIDYIPNTDSWKFSTLAINNSSIPTHPLSQLASITWYNGSQAWIYYIDPNGQLREVGTNDPRDLTWREGGTGPLGLTQNGTGVGACRYYNGSDENLEVFVQVQDGSIHGRVYTNHVWSADWYAVDSAVHNVAIGGSITATTIQRANGNDSILLSYIDSDDFVVVQSRTAVNVSAYNDFTQPNRLVEGSGQTQTGLSAIGSSGEPTIFFLSQNMLELSSDDLTAATWTTAEIPLS